MPRSAGAAGTNRVERYHNPAYLSSRRPGRPNALRASSAIPGGAIIFSEKLAWEHTGPGGAALQAYDNAFAKYPDNLIEWGPGGKAFIKLIDPERSGDVRSVTYMMNHTDAAKLPNARKPKVTESGLNGRPPRLGQTGTLRLTFRAARDIAIGEEITWAYNDKVIVWPEAVTSRPAATEALDRSDLFVDGELVYLTPQHAGLLYDSGVAGGWPAHRGGLITLRPAAALTRSAPRSPPYELSRTIRVVWANARNVRMNQETTQALLDSSLYAGIAIVDDDDKLTTLTLRSPFPVTGGGAPAGPTIRFSDSSSDDDFDGPASASMAAAFADLCVGG